MAWCCGPTPWGAFVSKPAESPDSYQIDRHTALQELRKTQSAAISRILVKIIVNCKLVARLRRPSLSTPDPKATAPPL